MELIIILGVSFFTGLLVKICDDVADSRLKIKGAKVLALLYGLGLGYLVTHAPLSSLWLGVIAGVALMGKIDNELHVLALTPVILAIIFYPLGNFDLLLFLIFTLAAIIDEAEFRISHYLLKQIVSRRIFLDITALFVSLILDAPLFFLSIFLFDIAYNFADYSISRLTSKGFARKRR